MLDYKFQISTFFPPHLFPRSCSFHLPHSLSLDLSCKKAFHDTLHNMTIKPELCHSPNHSFQSFTVFLYICGKLIYYYFFYLFFSHFIFSYQSVTLLLFLLETSELVLDGERCLLRLRRLQVDVDLLLLFLGLCCRCLLWRGQRADVNTEQVSVSRPPSIFQFISSASITVPGSDII